MKTITQERFRQIRGIFEAALEQPESARSEYLADACAGDAELAEEVRQLLQADGATEGALAMNGSGFEMAALQRQIGPYEILRELGRGGMGVVYLCRRMDGELRRLFALKVLRPGYADEEVVRRFRQERSILAALDHPNIARIYEEGRTAESLPFYTMEFVEGQPIHMYCDSNRLDVPARIALFQQVCSAVDYAHDRGVIHRDLKPGNILVTKDGLVKLLDFGIAKLLTPQDPMTLLVTDAGLRPMTPEYASPEQIRSEKVTRASDVYGLGVVLYELLTGHKPYRLKKRLYHEVLRVICEEEPTLPSAAVDLPEERDTISRLRQTTARGLRSALAGDMDSIILKALCKDPGRRYGSVSSFSADLTRHLQGAPVEARSGRVYRVGRELNRRRAWVAAGIFVLAAVASGGIHLTWPVLWTAAAVLAGFAFWHASADKEFGRRVAESSFWPVVIGPLTALAVLWLLEGADILAGWNAAGREPGENGGPTPDWVLHYDGGVSWAVGMVIIALLFLRWSLRGSWAGKLVLDASSRRSWLLGILALCAFAYSPAKMLLWGLYSGHLSFPVSTILHTALDALPWTLLYFLSGRLEIRESGIATAIGFYQWSRIESYLWSEAGLKVKISRLLPFLPDVSLRVPPRRRQETELAIARFLSEWPGATGNNGRW
jgi:serine/threonine protein kinase